MTEPFPRLLALMAVALVVRTTIEALRVPMPWAFKGGLLSKLVPAQWRM